MNVSFGYDAARPVLRDIDLRDPARQRWSASWASRAAARPRCCAIIAARCCPSARQRARARARHRASSTATALYAMRRKMGMLFQFGALFTDMSVYENVAFPLREHTDAARRADPRPGDAEAGGGRAARRGAPHAGRALGRHGAARGAGALDRARPAAHPLRRAVHRPRPDLLRRHRAPDPRAQRLARRHLDHRDARRAGGARRGGLRLLHGGRARHRAGHAGRDPRAAASRSSTSS